MRVPRSELGVAMLDGFVYAVGGQEYTSRLDSVEKYDPETNTWVSSIQLAIIFFSTDCDVPSLKMAVTSPAVVAYEDSLYVTGGAILEDGEGKKPYNEENYLFLM